MYVSCFTQAVANTHKMALGKRSVLDSHCEAYCIMARKRRRQEDACSHPGRAGNRDEKGRRLK